MPLDMQETRLADVASWLGITPVPNAVFEAHKIREAAKHPASWWYRHPMLADVSFRLGALLVMMGVVLCGVFSIVTLLLNLYMTALVAFISVLVLGFVFYRILATDVLSMEGGRFYGPAEWQEFTMPLLNVPAPRAIKAIASKIISKVPDAEVVYGRLVQNFITVDPYLAIRRGTDQIVIGIWDNGGTIHQASLDRRG